MGRALMIALGRLAFVCLLGAQTEASLQAGGDLAPVSAAHSTSPDITTLNAELAASRAAAVEAWECSLAGLLSLTHDGGPEPAPTRGWSERDQQRADYRALAVDGPRLGAWLENGDHSGVPAEKLEALQRLHLSLQRSAAEAAATQLANTSWLERLHEEQPALAMGLIVGLGLGLVALFFLVARGPAKSPGRLGSAMVIGLVRIAQLALAVGLMAVVPIGWFMGWVVGPCQRAFGHGLLAGAGDVVLWLVACMVAMLATSAAEAFIAKLKKGSAAEPMTAGGRDTLQPDAGPADD